MEAYLGSNWDTVSADEWSALLPLAPTNTIFQTRQWHSAWINEFNPRVFLIKVVRDGRCVGIAPLMVVTKGGVRVLKFLGSGHSDYCDFIYDKNDPSILSAIFDCLMTLKDDWDAMALDYIPEESSTVHLMRRLCSQAGLHERRYSRHVSSAIVFGQNKHLLRVNSAQKHFDYFQKKGGYKATHLKTEEQILPYLDIFFDQHVRRRDGERHKSLFLDHHNREFYRRCVRDLCRNQWLLLTVIHSQNQPIAFHFGFTYNRVFTYYKPSFEPKLAKFSPGQVLLREVLAYASEDGFDEFDFSLGREAYKSNFANSVRHNSSFKVFKSRRDLLAEQLISKAKVLFKQ